MGMQQRKDDFTAALLQNLPNMRRFALSLYSGRPNRESDAEDLLQDAIERALAYRSKFKGGNLRRWLFVIMKNRYKDILALAYNRHTVLVAFTDEPDGAQDNRRRRANATQQDEECEATGIGAVSPPQPWHLWQSKIAQDMTLLPPAKQRAIIATCIHGFTYEEFAAQEQIPIGTVRSRIARSRSSLFEELQYDLRYGL